MANILTQNPHIIDTAGAGTIIETPINVKKIRWVGATTAGHSCIVKDKNDNIFWESVAAGANYVEETDFTTYYTQSSVLQGLRVTTLGSGRLYIYH